MAIYNQTDLSSLLASDGIDPAVQASILNYLHNDGLLTGPGDTVDVQLSGYPPLDPNAQVLFVDTSPAKVITDSNLKVIVDTADAKIKVTGHNSVFVTTGSGDDRIDLTGSSGNDVVMSTGGDDTILGGSGADSIYGGSGDDSIVGGSGNHQLLVGGSGSDTITGGSGKLRHHYRWERQRRNPRRQWKPRPHPGWRRKRQYLGR